ncbi:MAG: dihydropteroate synthase [Rectinema sp.]
MSGSAGPAATEKPQRLLKLPRGRTLDLGGLPDDLPCIMGIVNVNQDSFFEGSREPDTGSAVKAALDMVGQGAHIIDFGAESTRPGSREIDVKDELARILPVIEGFRAACDAVISVDTRHPEVAAAVLGAGADIINDIEALARSGMAEIAARSQAAVVLMHMQGTPQTMQCVPSYANCLGEVFSFLEGASNRALEAGIDREAIILDPGIGFGKLKEHNLALLKGIDRLKTLGYPVLVGVSRKRLIGELTGKDVQERLAGSLGAALAAWLNGADILRVHDVSQTVDALRVFREVRQ